MVAMPRKGAKVRQARVHLVKEMKIHLSLIYYLSHRIQAWDAWAHNRRYSGL
ncbi:MULTISPECIES: hypothetical protein [Heyndrickxia]|uniref:hypothetical protein n=1 Tax=Heyndrickxia TaxID=2837504 RepID=UPI000ABBAE18|nr:hypothetical protein [Heyndrickxia shackletonii]MBB2481873.1 hypothetical protein [Bacillus sp. APMAM]NEZ02014.1 hypothetical protein [Heyndrickxia shackletonii]